MKCYITNVDSTNYKIAGMQTILFYLYSKILPINKLFCYSFPRVINYFVL